MRQEHAEKGPSWYDVRQTWAEVERAHKVCLLLSSTLVRNEGAPWHHWWVVEARVGGVSAACEVRCRAADKFPSNKHQTLPGLLYRLLLEIDTALDKQTAVAERQAMF